MDAVVDSESAFVLLASKQGNESNMGTILIDKLLSACVKQGASDLHITVGQPPVLRLHGRMQRLKTKVLEPADTLALMKSITPDRCQQELQETGSADFGFAFGDQARFRVSIFRQRGNVAMVLRQIPIKMWSMDELGVPPVFKRPDHAAARAGPRHGADRLGQDARRWPRWSTTSTRTSTTTSSRSKTRSSSITTTRSRRSTSAKWAST